MLNHDLTFETCSCLKKDVKRRVLCLVFLNSSTRQVMTNHELTFEIRYMKQLSWPVSRPSVRFREYKSSMLNELVLSILCDILDLLPSSYKFNLNYSVILLHTTQSNN